MVMASRCKREVQQIVVMPLLDRAIEIIRRVQSRTQTSICDGC